MRRDEWNNGWSNESGWNNIGYVKRSFSPFKVLVIGSVVGIMVFGGTNMYIKYLQRENDKLQQEAIENALKLEKQKMDNESTSHTAVDLSQSKKDLEEVKRINSELIEIRVVKDKRTITHAVEKGKKPEKGERPEDSWFIIEMSGDVEYNVFAMLQSADSEISADGKAIIVSVDRLSKTPEDVHVVGDLKVLKHPEPLMLDTEEKPEKWYKVITKRYFSNDYAYKAKPEEVLKYQQTLNDNFDEESSKVIEEKVMSDEKVFETYEQIALNKIEALYNSELKGVSYFDKNGEEHTLKTNIKTPVIVKFKDK